MFAGGHLKLYKAEQVEDVVNSCNAVKPRSALERTVMVSAINIWYDTNLSDR